MTERVALVAGSTLAAAFVCAIGLLGFFQWFGGVDSLSRFAGELFVLAIVPVAVSALLSSVWVSRWKRFGAGGHLANAARICLLSYPILWLVLSVTIWTCLRFEHHIPPYERPDGLLEAGMTAGGYTVLAFVIGVLPAIGIEYFVIRFVRKRWSPALSTGVVP